MKLGNLWPKDYLATMPNGEIKKFRLKYRENRKSLEGIELVFVNADETDSNLYRSRLLLAYCGSTGEKYDCPNECCAIEYNGCSIVLQADRCELVGCDLSWEERKKIAQELVEPPKKMCGELMWVILL